MKSTVLAAVLCAATVCSVPALAQTDTTFTYQGELIEAGAPADGSYSMNFKLFNALAGGSQVGSTVTIAPQVVSDGIFSSQLDFGPRDFSSTQYWLEIMVDGNTLSPRQAMTASPFSIQTRGIFVDSNNNVGVGTTFPFYPLHVENPSTSGRAIYSRSSSPTGFTTTGRFDNFSTTGTALSGQATSTTGTNTGVFGQTSSTNGRAVFGWASAQTGPNIGVEGQSSSTSGQGVNGSAFAAAGTTYGGWFRSLSTGGRGVFGWASANTGTTDGVFGQSNSTSGRGVCAWAPASSGTTYGVYSTNDSTSGTGVFGEARAIGGITYGGRFEADSVRGRGVFGLATATDGITYGVVGHSNSSDGYDFWASGAGTNYGSPSSRRFKSNIVPIGNPLDKLAQLQGVYFDWDEEHGGNHDVGMIAEEVGAVMPEIVNYEENGIDAIGMDYSKMTPLLVEAVNALSSESDRRLAEKDYEISELRQQLSDLQMIVERLASNQEKENR